jgi:hypothetical protein
VTGGARGGLGVSGDGGKCWIEVGISNSFVEMFVGGY